MKALLLLALISLSAWANFNQLPQATLQTSPTIGCFPTPSQLEQTRQPWYQPRPQFYPQVSYPAYQPQYRNYRQNPYNYYLPQDYSTMNPYWVDSAPRGYNPKANSIHESTYPLYYGQRASYQ